MHTTAPATPISPPPVYGAPYTTSATLAPDSSLSTFTLSLLPPALGVESPCTLPPLSADAPVSALRSALQSGLPASTPRPLAVIVNGERVTLGGRLDGAALRTLHGAFVDLEGGGVRWSLNGGSRLVLRRGWGGGGWTPNRRRGAVVASAACLLAACLAFWDAVVPESGRRMLQFDPTRTRE